MQILENKESVSLNPSGCVATIGVFDGVHLGHRFLINSVIRTAREKSLNSTIITFDREPKSFINQYKEQKRLSTINEKIELLNECGADRNVVLEFNKSLARMSAFDFLNEILHKKLDVKVLIIGYDHRFGHNREDGFDEYVKYGKKVGIEVIKSENFRTDKFENISSSIIREEIENGNICRANEMLSHPYSFGGKVVNGQKLGRTIGFPTANIEIKDDSKLIPGSGVYAVKVMYNNYCFDGMLNIGYRPTLSNENKKSIEVNIFNFDKYIYGEFIYIKCVSKVRDEVKFNSIKELTTQLSIDKDMISKILK